MTCSPDLEIRTATANDASAIQQIFAPYVRRSAATFEEEVPTTDEIEQRVNRCLDRWTWLVCDSSEGILGYAYSVGYRDLPAHRGSVETSIFLRADAQGQGLGKLLYGQLIEETRALGYLNAYSGITLPNATGIRLHLNLGFRFVGVFSRVGFKLGAWHDVAWWHLDLDSFPIPFD